MSSHADTILYLEMLRDAVSRQDQRSHFDAALLALAVNQRLREALREIGEAAASIPDRDVRVRIRDITQHALAAVVEE